MAEPTIARLGRPPKLFAAATERARAQLAELFRDQGDFIMFLGPHPGHPEYRTGQSWVERLGVAEDLARKALDRAGVVRHTSATAFASATDKFLDQHGVEQPYASVYQRLRGTTRYVRNPRWA
jgi:hypothetical protein